MKAETLRFRRYIKKYLRGRSGLASVQKDAVQAANLRKVLSTDVLIWVCTELNYYALKHVQGTGVPYSEQMLSYIKHNKLFPQPVLRAKLIKTMTCTGNRKHPNS